MPIKWSAVPVNEAMDMAEEFVNQAAEPLEQAKIVAEEARKIANLPEYMNQRLNRLISEIERVSGGVLPWSGRAYEGTFKNSIEAIRNAIPAGAIETERERLKHGRQAAIL